MITRLIKLANELDNLHLHNNSNLIDNLIKLASQKLPTLEEIKQIMTIIFQELDVDGNLENYIPDHLDPEAIFKAKNYGDYDINLMKELGRKIKEALTKKNIETEIWENIGLNEIFILIHLLPEPFNATSPTISMRQIELATRHDPIIKDLLNQMTYIQDSDYSGADVAEYEPTETIKSVLHDYLQEKFGPDNSSTGFAGSTSLFIKEKQLEKIDALWYINNDPTNQDTMPAEYWYMKWR